jgi:hypothetical protein
MRTVVDIRRSRFAVARWSALALAALAVLLLAGYAPSASGRTPSGHTGDHIVGTYDRSTLRLFVNGREVARKRVDRRVDSSSTPMEIGTFYAGSRWAGILDEVALYRRALTAATVRRHYLIGTGALRAAYASGVRRTPGVVAYWHLSEQAHRHAVDSVGRHAGVYPPGAAVAVPGLIARDPTNRAIAFRSGRGGITVPNASELSLTNGFTLEAWVTVAARQAQPIVVKVGSWFLQTDARGHWGVGFFSQRHDVSVYSKLQAEVHALPAAALRPPAARPPSRPAPVSNRPAGSPRKTGNPSGSPGESGGNSGSGRLILLLAFVGALVVAGWLVVKVRQGDPAPEEPARGGDWNVANVATAEEPPPQETPDEGEDSSAGGAVDDTVDDTVQVEPKQH